MRSPVGPNVRGSIIAVMKQTTVNSSQRRISPGLPAGDAAGAR